jgi:carboxypeptidase C (cathepsin A)
MRTIIIFMACLTSLTLLPGGPPVAWAASDNKTDDAAAPKEIFSTTRHSVRSGSGKVSYTATAGQLILKDDAVQQKAALFFIAYEKCNASAAERPITFAFNGGPGSSSVWLHFGAIGPQRVVLNDDGTAPPPPGRLQDNPFTWLAFTDIVFIDPVGTGYSRAIDASKKNEFYNFKNDIGSIGDFIQMYLTRYGRWLSPKFLVGESYGTTRAVGLVDYLHARHGIDLNGVALVSPVLDYNTILGQQPNTLPSLLVLPTYTASAWYHKKLPAQPGALEDALAAVETWAMADYLGILAQGNALPEEQQQAAAAIMANHTGLASDFILRNNLMVSGSRFRKELLRSQRKVIGRMDTRFAGPDIDAGGEAGTYDPSMDGLIGIFAGAINHYVRSELKFETELPYRYLNFDIGKEWDWSSAIRGGQGYVNVSQSLSQALHKNKYLQVFVAAGYYDMATPYFATRYTFNHLDLDRSLAGNITMRFYNAGHMMYVDLPSLNELSADVAAFYARALSPAKHD